MATTEFLRLVIPTSHLEVQLVSPMFWNQRMNLHLLHKVSHMNRFWDRIRQIYYSTIQSAFYNLVDNPDYQVKQGGYHKGENSIVLKGLNRKKNLYRSRSNSDEIYMDRPRRNTINLRRLLNHLKTRIAHQRFTLILIIIYLEFSNRKNMSPRSMRYLPYGARKFKKK